MYLSIALSISLCLLAFFYLRPVFCEYPVSESLPNKQHTTPCSSFASGCSRTRKRKHTQSRCSAACTCNGCPISSCNGCPISSWPCSPGPIPSATTEVGTCWSSWQPDDKIDLTWDHVAHLCAFLFSCAACHADMPSVPASGH